MELSGSGIRVSLIEPGPITTRFTENVTQTMQDKPVKNPGIASLFTGKPEDVVKKSSTPWSTRTRKYAILLRVLP